MKFNNVECEASGIAFAINGGAEPPSFAVRDGEGDGGCVASLAGEGVCASDLKFDIFEWFYKASEGV